MEHEADVKIDKGHGQDEITTSTDDNTTAPAQIETHTPTKNEEPVASPVGRRDEHTDNGDIMTPVVAADTNMEEQKVLESAQDKRQSRMSVLHDSMVTVRLSEPSPTRPPSLMVITAVASGQSKFSVAEKPNSSLPEEEPAETEESPRITMLDEEGNVVFDSPTGSESAHPESRRGSDSSEESLEGGGVNWEELQQTEEKEPKNESSDDSTALLLARLEQENNLLATNPKSGIAKVKPAVEAREKGSRPPSIQHLKKLVNGPTPASLRYSMAPAPPMTDLEFYAALVQDYTRTAQCLPTLLSKKIRSGVPPPLRGVVWQSMSGARDQLLESQFDRLCGESSPYEGLIGKDLGRSFPGVEMFRDPEGDGQRMLGRVLKCFSLYDHKIGYCQGLGFLVGPLLMHMGDRQAFCVLVRLMEHYDLRACFLPDLSGLHVRIYQFRQLLKQHIPNLAAHLENLQIEPAYVSQWFLSFFAVTCPLPMLFRIYDVIFAEGASETIMRVALSLMRKNEEKITACTELEDVMQLLLSRGLWDVYHYNADEFVNDFVGLTGVVTHESLQALEMSYKEAQVADVTASENVGSVATRFLGRLWTGSNSSTKSANLSPGLAAPTRPVSFLKRSPSKQSLASTLNSVEGGASESMLSSSTDATSRDSSNTDESSVRTHSVNLTNGVALPTKSNKDKGLHSQIEDLLTALSEMQRDHAILSTQLQREREEREEDKSVVRALLDGLKKKTGSETADRSEGSVETIKAARSEAKVDVENEAGDDTIIPEPKTDTPEHNISSILNTVEARFIAPKRRSSMLTTKSQLRDELARANEQLIIEVSKTQEFSRCLDEQKQEIKNLTEQVKEGHGHIRSGHAEKQRLERQMYELRMNTRKGSSSEPSSDEPHSEWPKVRTSSSSTTSGGGLRELRLGRQNSTKSIKPTFSKRTSSLNAAALINNKENEPFATALHMATVGEQGQERGKEQSDIDAMVLELVQAKTAKAIAEQEAEEAKQKLENFKKMLSGSGSNPEFMSHSAMGGKGHRTSPSVSTTGGGGLGSYFSGVSGYGAEKPKSRDATTPPAVSVNGATTPGPAVGSWFGGGWAKRAVSSGGGT